MRKLLLFLGLILLAVGTWVVWALKSPLQPSTPTFVMLRPGFSTRRIANELQSAGVIRSATAFRAWHYLHRSHRLKAGEYLFEHPANTPQVYERLARGDIYFHTVTIPEGFTIEQIAERLEAQAGVSGKDFREIAEHGADRFHRFYLDGISTDSLEGYLFPKTYRVARGATAKSVIEMMNHLKDIAVPVKAAEKMTPEQLKGKVLTGVLHKEEKPEYTEEYAKVIGRAQAAK